MSPTVSGTVADSQGNTAAWSASWTVSSQSGAFPGDPGPGQMLYGASMDGGDPDAFEAQQLGGRALQPFRCFFQSTDTATAVINTTAAHQADGRLPWISLKLPGSGSTRWGNFAAGQSDTWFRAILNGLNGLSRPTWLTLHHEPATGDNSGSTTDYRNMYAHAMPLVQSLAGSKVALAPIFVGEEFESSLSHAVQYIPAASDMSFFGFDIYNAWSPTNGKNYRQFSDRASFILPNVPAGKKWAVGEWGVRDDPTNMQRGPAYMQSMYDFCLADGRCAGVSYFNSSQNSPDGPWTLTGVRLSKFASLQNPNVTPTTARTA
jgi:hypothetical protein